MNHAAVNPPRRKRLKVVRACSSCRRKKTKCNGELPCAPCLKTHSTCQYSNTTNTTKKLVQQKQTQPPTDSVSQMTSTPIALNTKLLLTSAISKSPSMSTLETNHSTGSLSTNSIPSIDTPLGTTGRHDIHAPNTASTTTINGSRPRSPNRKPVTYTIQSIEQRLLEIEKTLGLLLQRHYPALPGLILSSPSSSSTSSSTSTDACFKTRMNDSTPTLSTPGISSTSSLTTNNVSPEFAFGDHHSPRINLTLPPLQTRPLNHDASTSSTSSAGNLLPPYHDTNSLFDRKIPVLQPLLTEHRHQQSQQGTPTMAPPPHSPTYYHHSSLQPIAHPPSSSSSSSCIP